MRPYIPTKLPLKKLDWAAFVGLVGKANAEVARFDGLLQSMPNPGVLLSPLSTQEAVLSSKIEGTQATLQDVLEFEANPKDITRKHEDIQEVLNYRKAMAFAVKELGKYPLTLNVIKEIHSKLMQSVRGKNKNPGNFRTEQNWIGKPGCKQEEASYIPPSPETIKEFLSNLEKYINFDDKDYLVQLAIIHAQFEIIHPFLDGNGRIGRMLMPLFLYYKKVLSSPMFYLSAYFETDRERYYSSLKSISKEENWNSWVEYFLNAVVEQSKKNIQKAKKIHALYDQKKLRISQITHSRYSIQTLDFLFCMPIFKSREFKIEAKIPEATSKRVVDLLLRNEVISLIKKGQGRAGNIYAFEKLLNIVR